MTEDTSLYDAIAYMADGEMESTIGGELHIVKAGEIILIPAETSQ